VVTNYYNGWLKGLIFDSIQKKITNELAVTYNIEKFVVLSHLLRDNMFRVVLASLIYRGLVAFEELPLPDGITHMGYRLTFKGYEVVRQQSYSGNGLI